MMVDNLKFWNFGMSENTIDKMSEATLRQVALFKDLMVAEAGQRLEISKELAETLHRIEYDLANDPTDDFEGLMGRATRLSDGTAVFMSKGATIHREDGEPVSNDDIAALQWKENSPSFEEFMVAKAKNIPKWKKKPKKKNGRPTYEEYAELVVTQERLEKKQAALKSFHEHIIGYIRKRLNDAQNPPSADEIQKFDEILKAGPIKI